MQDAHELINRGDDVTRFPRARTDTKIHEIDDEALLYDPRTADTHRLNATAYHIWRHCNGRQDVASIAAHLARDFEVDESEAAVHVSRLVEVLSLRGLLDAADEHSISA